MYIQAESYSYHHCIQPVGSTSTIPEPQTLEELRASSDPGYYTVKFQANWMLQMDTNHCSFAADMNSTRITCLGEARIELVETLRDSVSCNPDGESVLECTDTRVGSGFSGVIYVSSFVDSCPLQSLLMHPVLMPLLYTVFLSPLQTCSGAVLPETHVEYLPQEASCEEHPSDETILRNLQMGIHCNTLNPCN
jgi:hypothetical protein